MQWVPNVVTAGYISLSQEKNIFLKEFRSNKIISNLRL